MRVPSSPQPNNNHSPTSNLVLHTNNNPTTTFTYEPTSVLDLCRSPSPEKKLTVPKPEPQHNNNNNNLNLDLDDHVLPNSDWWESIMKDLALPEDSPTPLLKTNINPSCIHNIQAKQHSNSISYHSQAKQSKGRKPWTTTFV